MMVWGRECRTGRQYGVQIIIDIMKTHRGQILISIKTEISDSIDTAPSEVEVEPTQTINEVRKKLIILYVQCQVQSWVLCI